MATGSGLPHTVVALTLELLCPGIPVFLRPGHTGHPTPAGQALPQSVSDPERQTGCVLGSWRKKLTSSQSPRVLPAVQWHFLRHCLLSLPWSPARCGSRAESLWGWGRALQASEELPVPEQIGLCMAASGLFLRMIEHLHPSVVDGPSSFPAGLASANPSPAVLDQPIHHTDWCSPHQFSCSPCYPNLS